MNTKVSKIKTDSPNDAKKLHELSFAQKIAVLCGCSVRYVELVLAGERKTESALAQSILIASEKIKESDNKLLTAVKKAVPFGDSKLFIEK